MTPEFILFWSLVNGEPRSQGGFDEIGCAEAAQRLRVAVTQTVEASYVETQDGIRHETRGEIWCVPAHKGASK